MNRLFSSLPIKWLLLILAGAIFIGVLIFFPRSNAVPNTNATFTVPATVSPHPVSRTAKATSTIPFIYKTQITKTSTTTLGYLTTYPEKTLVQKINDQIKKLSIVCTDANSPQANEFYDETYGDVKYASKALFSQHVVEDNYCGGAHPNSYEFGVTYDLKTGNKISYQELFGNYNRDKTSIENMLTLAYVAQRKKEPDYNESDGCGPAQTDDGIYASIFDDTTSYYLAPGGVWFIPTTFPHVIAVCAEPTFVPINAIKAYLDPKSPIKNI